jgi:predicted Holliday junction resolvase-like endonuclease
MSNKEVSTISPEGLEVANMYLQFGNIRAVSQELQVPENKVAETLNKREVKRYIDTVYLDIGYRNRNNIAAVFDEIIASKLEEAQESGVFSGKDLVDIMQIQHKMRMDEAKLQLEYEKAHSTNIKNQTNVQINDTSGAFGGGRIGALAEKLFNGEPQ